MGQTKLIMEINLRAAHAGGDVRAHFHCGLMAKFLLIGRQSQVLVGFRKAYIGCLIRVACRIFYNVKQNAYRCLPPGGNSCCRCSW